MEEPAFEAERRVVSGPRFDDKVERFPMPLVHPHRVAVRRQDFVWHTADEARFDNSLGGPGPRATPTVAGGRVYAVGATGLFNCLDGATGKVKWKWLPSTAANGFGPTSMHRGVSVGGGKVYTTAAGNRVVALDQNTGAIVWAVTPTPPAGSGDGSGGLRPSSLLSSSDHDPRGIRGASRHPIPGRLI